MVSIENIFAAGAAVLAGRQLGAKDTGGASRTVTTVIGISMLSASEVLAGTHKVVLLTESMASPAFPLSEVPELKKNSRGVKAVTFDKNDTALAFAKAVDSRTETIFYKGKELSVKRIRVRARAAKAQKVAL